jgi:cell division protein FtsX
MRIVGPAQLYRWPFFLEGLIIGYLGGLIAVILVGTAYTGNCNISTIPGIYAGRASHKFLSKCC